MVNLADELLIAKVFKVKVVLELLKRLKVEPAKLKSSVIVILPVLVIVPEAVLPVISSFPILNVPAFTILIALPLKIKFFDSALKVPPE